MSIGLAVSFKKAKNLAVGREKLTNYKPFVVKNQPWNSFNERYGKILKISRKEAKLLTNSRKSNNPIETLFKVRKYILLSIYSNSYLILRFSIFSTETTDFLARGVLFFLDSSTFTILTCIMQSGWGSVQYVN